MPVEMTFQVATAAVQPTAADCVDYLKRIKPLTKAYEENLEKRHIEIGFNLFELISDHYYRETFHSDILNALLNPESKHGEKNKFLQLFLTYLCSQPGAAIDPSHYLDAIVTKGKGHIDVLITGSKHAIIIENKINDAIDQRRQIPGYLDYVEVKMGYHCDAIIYLRLNGNTRPDMAHWNPQQIEQVIKKLIVICAFDGNEDSAANDLLRGWVLKCEKAAQANSDAQHVLRQYGGIIKKLGRAVMNKPIMKKFYEIMVEGVGENFKTALSLKKMLDGLIFYRVENIKDKLQHNLEPFRKIENYQGYDAKLSNFLWNDANFGLDIIVGTESYSFEFWDTLDRDGTNKGRANAILHNMRCLSDYTCKEGGVFFKEFKFPSEETKLIEHIIKFKEQLLNAVKSESG